MKQDSLQASDETEQPVRESGIFTDLSVRQHDDTPAPEPGRSVPPPPPRTASATVPVAQRTQYEASSTNSQTAPDWEEFDVGEVNADFGPDEEFASLQGLSPSTPRRSESAQTASPRSVPPPPSRRSVPTLPGVSFPDPQSAGRPRSVPPGMWEVSPRFTEAAADERWTPPAERFTPPSVREMSGTFQRASTGRVSHAAVTHELASAAVARGDLTRRDSSYATPVEVMNPRMLSYALLVAALLIAGCFVGYVLSNRARPGVVQLTTEPADAQVLLDGVAVGSVSPFLETGVTPGTKHHLEVRKDGFRSWDQQVEVQPGQTLVFTVALPREEGWDAPRVAAVPLVVETVAAATAPPEAPVVADVVQAFAPPVAAVPAMAANVEARPRRASSATPSEPVSNEPVASAPVTSAPVTSAPVTSAPVASAPVASPSGTLRVSSRPWSVVTIDGKVVGNTPQMSLSLAAGAHRVHLRSPDFDIEKELNVSIRAGETETLIVNLP